MARLPCLTCAVLLALSGYCALQAEPPLLYLPFDGSLQPAVRSTRASDATPDLGPSLPFVPGRRGQAVTLRADCRLPSAGHLNPDAGTVAFWIRPDWEGADRRGRTLFCVYGRHDIQAPWMHNRWSLTTQAGRLTGVLYGASDAGPITVSADIASWRLGSWHHIALTWQGVNSDRPDGQLCLYADGVLAERRDGFQLTVGAIGDSLDLGRDSDDSPEYAEADLDEFYLYGRALAPAEIASAVALVDQPEAVAAATPPEETSACGPEWWNGAWRYRCAVRVSLPASATEPYPTVRLPLNLNADLASLGLARVADPASLRLIPADATSGSATPGTAPLPTRLDGDTLAWALPENARPGAPFSAWLYVGGSALDTSTPLFARLQPSAWSTAPQPPATAGIDYASATYGDAWDFDEGDLEEIDQWGNKPEFVRQRAVRDGVLSMDVSTDPWFIWGDMWGQVQSSRRPVAIDLQRYPILRLRLRQSCPEARWDLYARVGAAAELLHHEFRVHGSGWQTVSVDLVHEAGWGGTLSAFRIDPTSEVAEAHVEIDTVSLTHEILASRDALECLGPADTEPPQRLELSAAALTLTAGRPQTVTLRALDAQGRGIAGWPLTLSLASASDGHLTAVAGPSLEVTPVVRRAISGPDGSAVITLVAGRRAGPTSERLTLTAAGSPATATLSLEAVPGPPHHCRVTPDQPLRVRAADLPITFTAQIEDDAGNALPVPGRTLSFRVPKGVSVQPEQAVTDATGATQMQVSVDPSECWMWRLEVEDNEGLRGASAPLTFLPDGPRPDPIHILPNGYFADSAGRPFVPLGGFYANWVQSATPDDEWGRLQSFTDTTDQQKREWMRFLAENGVTAMRFMLRTHRDEGMEPMDIVGRVNPDLFAEAVHYLDLARDSGMRFQLVLHEDYVKPVYVNRSAVERYALPRYTPAQRAALPPHQRRFLTERTVLVPAGLRYTDPDAMACQDQYARELVQALLGNPQVFSYELENEMVDCPAAWVNHAVETIHSVDPSVLVGVSHGGGGLHTGDPLYWHRHAALGYYNYHLYPAGTTTPELDYGALVDVLTRYGRLAGVCFMGESAGDEFGRHPDRDVRRWVMRDIIWMALTNGNPGVFFWNARGAEVREFRLAREAMGLLDLANFRRRQPEIGIEVTHPLDNDQYYRTPQGLKDSAMMGRYANHYLSLGVDTDFTVSPAVYARTCTLAEFAPPEPSARPFQTGPGWQLRYLAREDWREVLVYVRNLARVEPWAVEEPGHSWQMFLRTREVAALRLGLDLPAGPPYEARLYNLDTQTARTLSAPPVSTLDLGTTDHDWVLVLKRP